MAKTKRAHILISGVVQGVAFRYYTRYRAQQLDLKGWVRNCPDGKVEILVEGEGEKVKELIEWCHQGPPSAIVAELKVEWQEYIGEYKSFELKF